MVRLYTRTRRTATLAHLLGGPSSLLQFSRTTSSLAISNAATLWLSRLWFRFLILLRQLGLPRKLRGPRAAVGLGIYIITRIITRIITQIESVLENVAHRSSRGILNCLILRRLKLCQSSLAFLFELLEAGRGHWD